MDANYGDALLAALKDIGLPPQRVVLEVPEQAGSETTRFSEIIDSMRKSGFLIALDGFGVKHSNIDRVWQLRPDIVTLDRCLLQQATEHSHIECVLPRLVSLLHKSGQLVLMGGLSDRARGADRARMQRRFRARRVFRAAECRCRAQRSGGQCDGCADGGIARADRGARPGAVRAARSYVSGLERASVKLMEGETLITATGELLQLADTARRFLLDQSGRQIGDNVVPIVRTSQRAKRFSPLLHSEGAS